MHYNNNSQTKQQLIKQLAQLLRDQTIQHQIPNSLKKQALNMIQRTQGIINSPQQISEFLTTKKFIQNQNFAEGQIKNTKVKQKKQFVQMNQNIQNKQNKWNRPITKYVKLLNTGCLKTIQPNEERLNNQLKQFEQKKHDNLQKCKQKSTKRLVGYKTIMKNDQNKSSKMSKSKQISRSKQKSKSPSFVKKTIPNKIKNNNNDESINLIFKKQKQIQNEKAYLQQKVGQLKHLIEQQKNRNEQKARTKNIATQQTCFLQKSYESLSNSVICKKKQNQNLKQQQKDILRMIQQLKNEKEVVNNAISQENEIINMYKMVIEQLKNQIRNESKSRNALKNELITGNNTLQKLIQKFQLLYDKTQMLIHNIDKNVRSFLN